MWQLSSGLYIISKLSTHLTDNLPMWLLRPSETVVGVLTYPLINVFRSGVGENTQWGAPIPLIDLQARNKLPKSVRSFAHPNHVIVVARRTRESKIQMVDLTRHNRTSSDDLAPRRHISTTAARVFSSCLNHKSRRILKDEDHKR